MKIRNRIVDLHGVALITECNIWWIDNAVVLCGIKSAAWLYKEVCDDKKCADVYYRKHETMQKCIKDMIWNAKDEAYYVRIAENEPAAPDWNQFYPDACCRLLAGVFEVIDRTQSKINNDIGNSCKNSLSG